MVVSPNQLEQVAALISARFPEYSYVHPQVFQITATVPANQSAGVNTNASMLINGTAYTSFPVPQSWVVVIKDMYITALSADPTDAQVTIFKNNNKTLAVTDPLSANLASNPSRPGLSAPYLYEPNSSLQLPVAPVGAAGTAVTTDTFFISTIIYDASYS